MLSSSSYDWLTAYFLSPFLMTAHTEGLLYPQEVTLIFNVRSL